jgi:uroporphyrin-III C-methyltransferase/precorrin-2 dehydrogenase/sirohydrochlorin ferrochelatase
VSVYPLGLRLAGRDVLVVGAGPVAARRVRGLLEADARVHVVAPHACEEIVDAARHGRVRWSARRFRPEDLNGAWLVHVAADDTTVNARVTALAEEQRVWCVRADDATAATAWTSATAHVGAVTVAVNADGDPGLAVALRNAIAAQLDDGGLPLRRRRARAGWSGRVALVGGGPGDPGLITTRGRRLLAEADVVVVDRLAPRALLDTLDPDVVVIDAGKAPDEHPVPQAEINRLLVEHAHAGRRVVRLKGGDPYVLGRGGEEATACLQAGVPVEVVPGVTSAIAVPAVAGIPVTHRGVSPGFTVLTAHDDVDWAAVAGVPGTLVLLMGVSRLSGTCAALVAGGRAATTPAAVVEDGFGPRQRMTVGTLTTLPTLAAARGVRAPAVVVVGDVVDLAPRSDDAVVLVGHGSRDPRSREVSLALAAMLERRLAAEDAAGGGGPGEPAGPTVVLAQLDHDGPRPHEAVAALLASGRRRIRVVPLLFSRAYHVTVDLPRDLAALDLPDDVQVTIADPLLDDRLLAGVDQQLAGAAADLDTFDGLVLAHAGTSNLDATAELEALAARWGRHHDVPAVLGHASGPGRSVTEAVATLRERGCQRVWVGLLMLGPGLLPDKARGAALDAGAVLVGPPLGAHPAVVDVLAARVTGVDR